MKEICCANCHYFEKRDDEEYLNWSSSRYICKLHKLYNGEVCDPLNQYCPQHYSLIAKMRSDKLHNIGI